MFVDFDGTLAPIVDDPAAARPHDLAVAVLRDLARRWAVVAVVSGRPAAFLAEHLRGADGAHLHGLYGLEWAAPGSDRVETRPGAEQWRAPVAAAAAEAEEVLGRSAVERKGLTVTLHFRSDPARAAAVAALTGELAGRHGLVAHDGKMSTELRPPVKVDQGTVLRELSSGLSAVAFSGDDLGDVPAFGVLNDLRSEGVATLSVASGGAETPAVVLRAADVTVDGPDGIVEVLRQLAEG